MIKSLLKKSKIELIRIILLLVFLVTVLGLFTFSKVFTIEKSVTDVSGFTPRPGTDPYEIEPGGSMPPRDLVTPTPAPRPTNRCIRFRTFRICGPYF